MKILIVEDETILGKVLEEKFQKENFETQLVKDGEEVLKAAKKFMSDLILLDLILPKKSGFLVLEELRTDPELRPIPVIVLSNLDQEEDIKRAFDLGAKDYFVKARHSLKEIIEKVKSYLFS